MTIQDIYHVMHVAKINNDAKVSLHVRDGVRYLCIHRNRIFTTVEGALSYLREDGRSIVAPENRKVELELAVAA